LFAAQGLLDLIRGRVSVRVGASLDESLTARVFEAVVRQPLKLGTRGPGIATLHDLDNIRSFLSGQGSIALLDLPWMPVYLAIIFAFHSQLVTALPAPSFSLLTLLTEVSHSQLECDWPPRTGLAEGAMPKPYGNGHDRRRCARDAANRATLHPAA
jgi:ABC-type protease/lipase transport system fused ATPase/permease subunit